MPWCSLLHEMQLGQFLRLIAMQLRLNREHGHVFLKHSLKVASWMSFCEGECVLGACAPHEERAHAECDAHPSLSCQLQDIS